MSPLGRFLLSICGELRHHRPEHNRLYVSYKALRQYAKSIDSDVRHIVAVATQLGLTVLD